MLYSIFLGDLMEKIGEISLLFDFYGELLTPKQIQIFELYYNDDLSLGEISEEFKISRQGVHDTLKRVENLLYKYEEKLGIVKKFLIQKSAIYRILSIIDEIENSSNMDYIRREIQKIKEISSEVIEDS